MKRKISAFLLILSCFQLFAQEFPFRIKLDSISVPELGGLQSFAVGQSENQWLIVGGRLDGLHRRQPWASFDIQGHNDQMVVVDPIKKQKWSAKFDQLDTALQEQLRSTNMQFIQRGHYLYLTGGYGFSQKVDDHITFPFLTVVDIPKTIEAIKNGNITPDCFWRIQDDKFALCGGQLNFLDGVFTITGGHRFDGRYHPMNNSTFDQVYSSEVRRFQIDDDAKKVTHLSVLKEGEILRRRDFNVLPSVDANGKQSLVAFSGVFQKDVDLPYLSIVDIHSEGIKLIPGFAQYYNHYHCANTSAFNSKDGSMHYLFFGGIAHYYDSSGLLVCDNDVPFTPAISRISKDANGQFQEWKLPIQMPGYFGAASEFILNPNLKLFDNEVIGLQELSDSTLIGYIFGGIQSSAANIFWINTGRESIAAPSIFPVYLIKDDHGDGSKLNDQSTNGIQLQVFPEPLEKRITLWFNAKSTGTANVKLSNEKGMVLIEKKIKKLKPGRREFTFKYKKIKRGDRLTLQLSLDNVIVNQILVVN